MWVCTVSTEHKNWFSARYVRYECWRIPPQGCESGCGRIRTFLSGSGKFSPDPDPISNVVKQGKNILKIELLHTYRKIFQFFQIKIIILQISEELGTVP